MDLDSSVLLTVVALAALAPGITAWWTGRQLARSIHDPTLPELLLARRQRTLQVFAFCAVFAIVLGGRQSWWSIPLLAVALIAGTYPLRRTLGIETQGVARYGWRCAKSVVGGFGFWLVLVVTPEIVLSIDARYRLLSLALVPLLLAWEHWGVPLWLWAHDAAPLADADVERRVAAIAERAGTAAPALYRIGGTGTRFMNAVALPSARHPAIGLGNALLELLDADEVAAIYAHELSHIEQHGPRSLRRRQAENRGLVLLGVAAGFGASWLALPWASLIPALWALVPIAVLAHRGRRRKQREMESDLRAAALCGDAEVVARALVKLHVHAMIPRRLPVDYERRASHPSLARRVQALRAGAAAASPVPMLGAPVVLATASAGSIVVLDDDRAHWFDGVPADVPDDLASLRTHAASTRSVVWDALVELRVAAAGAERVLRATHRNGESWSVPLAPAQVTIVQRALDRIDWRLHRELGRRPFPDTRLIAVATLLALLLSRDVGVLLVPAALAALLPSTAALAALGTMACGAALFGLLRDGSSGADALIPIVVLAALGALGLWRVWHRRRHDAGQDALHDAGSRAALLVLGGLAAIVLLLVGIAATDLPPASLAQLPLVGTLAITLAGLAAALVTTSARRARATAAALATAGVLAAATAVWSMDAFGAHRGGLTRTRVAARETGRIPLPRNTSSVQLSPDGDWFLAQHVELAESREGRFPYTLGSTSGVRREVHAVAAAFTGGHQLLALRTIGDSLGLELQDVDSSGALWRQALPRLTNPRLAVSPGDRAWVVSGIDEATWTPVVVTGRVGSPSTAVRRLRRADAAGVMMGVVRVGERLVVPAYDLTGRDGVLVDLNLLPFRVGLWEIDDAGRRQVGEVDGIPQCGGADGGYAACIVRQRGRSEIWTLGPHGQLSRVASIPRADIVRSLGPGRRITSLHDHRSVVIVDAGARRIADVDVAADSGYAMDASSIPGRLAVLWRGNAGAAVAFYDVP